MNKKFLVLIFIIYHFTFNMDNCLSQWVQMSNGIATTLQVNSFAISGNKIFSGSANGVYYSTNDGSNWTISGLSNQNVLTLAVSGSNLFAGTNGSGVFLSTDNGTSWAAVNTGLANLNVTSLAFSGENLVAGTNGGGIFISANSGTLWTTGNPGLTNLFVQTLKSFGFYQLITAASGLQ